MEDNKVLDVVEAVPIQSQIENETLDAFTPMKIDSVLNNAQASVDVEIDNEILDAFTPMNLDSVFNPAPAEPWDPYFNVARFSSLTSPRAWYKIDKVRVNYMWMNEENNKLYIILLDIEGKKQAAVVPEELVEFYKNRDLVGKVFSLNHFQIAYTDPTEYPRYHNYSLIRCDWVISVNKETVLTEVPFTDHSGFPTHGWIPSIKALSTDNSTKKMLIDTIGRVTRGGLIHHRGGASCELFLRDVTGAEIQFTTRTSTLREEYVKLATVLREKGVIFISRAKLIHKEPMNILVDTELTQIEYNPTMPKAGPLKNMKL